MEGKWQGKNKAITFSFDDGVTQDAKLIGILNEYGLKATFNLNSSLLGTLDNIENVRHDKVKASEVYGLYKGNEVAVHTLTHPNLTALDEETIIRQVEKDREELSSLCGYEVFGMAYPCGGVNNDDRVAEIIRKNTPIKYARTITSTHNFDLQDNLLRFNPSVYWTEDCFSEIVDKFLSLETDKPQILYIWGHSFELDHSVKIDWAEFEKVCKKLSGKKDIFYGTNSQVLL